MRNSILLFLFESEISRKFLIERLMLLWGLNLRMRVAFERLLVLQNPHFVALVVV